MANHLHWYTGGTIGAADGEEVDISSPFSLGTVNTFTDIISYPTSTVGVANFCPLIGFPLYLRTEAGFEISNRRTNLLCKSKFYRWRSCEFVCGNGI